MNRNARLAILGGGLGLCLVALGFLEIAADRPARFLTQYGDAVRERPLLQPGREATPWTAHLQRVEDALAQKNASAAMRAWHDAYAAARGSRRWEGLVELGDAYLRIGEVSGSRKAYEPRAHQLYLDALFRAQRQRALDGVLRVVEAFSALGDHEAVQQGLRMAQSLSDQMKDAQVQERVQTATEWLDAQYRGWAISRFRYEP